LDALIGPPTAREFCRSAPGRLQLVDRGVEVVLEEVPLLLPPPPPQATTSRLTATNKLAPATRQESRLCSRCIALISGVS
jgi:hypothetical protein